MPRKRNTNLCRVSKSAKRNRKRLEKETPIQRAYRLARANQRMFEKRVLLRAATNGYSIMNINSSRDHDEDDSQLLLGHTFIAPQYSADIGAELLEGEFKAEPIHDYKTEIMEGIPPPMATVTKDNNLTNLNVTDIWLPDNEATCNTTTKTEIMEGIPPPMATVTKDNNLTNLNVTDIWLPDNEATCNTTTATGGVNVQSNQHMHHWTDLQTNALVQEVFEAIDNKPECFEKPKKLVFYQKIRSKSSTLAAINWTIMSNRMKYLKTQYLKAAVWKEENTSSDIPMDQKCPNFDKLAFIFKNSVRDIDTSSTAYESAHDSVADSANSISTEIVKRDAENPNSSKGCDELELKIEAESRCGTPQPLAPTTKRASKRQCTQVKKEQTSSSQQIIHKPKKKKKKANDSTVIPKAVQMQQLIVEKERLQVAKENHRRNFLLKMQNLKNDFELKKFEIEKIFETEERLKKYEIDKKLESEINLRKYEIDLKLKNMIQNNL